MPKEVLMCVQCRKDKKTCKPKQRKWPGECCDRCIKFGYKCSANTLRRDETQKAQTKETHGRRRSVTEILMDLDYWQYLRAATMDTDPSDPDHGRWNDFTEWARLAASAAIEEIFADLRKEAEGIRDSLLMSKRSFEAWAIEEMLRYDPRNCSRPEPLRKILTNMASMQGQTFLRHPLWDLESGRIFSVVRLANDRSDVDAFDACEFTVSRLDSRRSLKLFQKAVEVQSNILARYITPEFSERHPVWFTNIKEVLQQLDPIDLRAIRCLSDEQTIEYLESTHVTSQSLPSHSGRYCFSVAIDEKTEPNPLTRDFFSKRFPYRNLLNDIYPLLQDNGEVTVQSKMYPSGTPDWEVFLHVIESAGSILPCKRHPFISEDRPLMEFFPRVELNGLALAATYDRLSDLQDIQLKYPDQISYRAKVSNAPYLAFPGAGDPVYRLSEHFSVFHLAAWNSRPDCLKYLLRTPGASGTLSPFDFADLYAIGLMRQSLELIEVLEHFRARRYRRSEHSIIQTIAFLALDYAPITIMETMIQGGWCSAMDFKKDILPRIIRRVDYWQSQFPRDQRFPMQEPVEDLVHESKLWQEGCDLKSYLKQSAFIQKPLT
ncbi:hypothetical protein ABW20_dc0106057 [Dactylellina cionopaga]|nr:hypothetical protein ABW20_dc0106057 [Dactylellina cionopaga]